MTSNSIPTTLKIEHRSVFGWPATPAGYGPCDRGMVAHYNGPATGLNSRSHDSCRQYWDNTRDFHINGNGWPDIGYSYMVCPHGIVLEGRGKEKVQAAQPGGNETYTSCTFGIGGNEVPTDAALQGWALLRQWLKGQIGLGSTVYPHSHFISTDCPGPKISPMVSNGTLSKTPKSSVEAAADMALEKYLDIGADKDQVIKVGSRASLSFETEWYDKANIHTDTESDGTRYPSVFPDKGAGSFITQWMVNLGTKDPVGGEARLHFARYDRDTNVLDRDVRTVTLSAGDRDFMPSGILAMADTHKYRIDVSNDTDQDIVVSYAYWVIVK